MKESGPLGERFPVTYFDGVNSTVQPSLAKRTELSHAENVRSPQIGVLEKREGQVVKGTTPTDTEFVAEGNYGLFHYNDLPWRLTQEYEVFGTPAGTSNTTGFDITIVDYITVSDNEFLSDGFSVNNATGVDLFSLDANDHWNKIADPDGQKLSAAKFDTASVETDMMIVNGTNLNRYLTTGGSVITSEDAGHLYNSPTASRVVYYKNRIHLANFTRNSVNYPTTIIRSSFPLGIISLVDGDHAAAVTTISVTDSKYFYSAAGMNSYEVYRGGTLIETLTVTDVNETTIEVNATANVILSSDEIWIGGTYSGAKQFRWVNNPTSTGRDVKQYDTFKLTGGENGGITLFDTIGNVLLIGNSTTLAAWDDYTLQNFDLGIGCASSRGYVKMLGTLYFLDYGGVYGTTGGLPTLLSRKVERYIKGATKSGLENAAAGVKGLSVFFTIGDVTLYNEDGSMDKVMRDVCLEYNAGDQNWYVHSNVPNSQFMNFLDDDGREQLWGTSESESYPVMSFLEGDTDNNSEIFMRFDTQEIQLLKEFETHASPLAVMTEVYRGSQTKCFVSLDKEKFYELEGTVTKGVSTLKVHSSNKRDITPPICRKIKLSYRDTSKQRCRINQFAIIYTPTTIDEATE